jgi:hypothetical protein
VNLIIPEKFFSIECEEKTINLMESPRGELTNKAYRIEIKNLLEDMYERLLQICSKTPFTVDGDKQEIKLQFSVRTEDLDKLKEKDAKIKNFFKSNDDKKGL